jgi:hypothetical protein
MDRERHLKSKLREEVEKHLKACEVPKPRVDSMVREAKRAHVRLQLDSVDWRRKRKTRCRQS